MKYTRQELLKMCLNDLNNGMTSDEIDEKYFDPTSELFLKPYEKSDLDMLNIQPMRDICPSPEPLSWWKQLYVNISMYLKWNAPILRRIYTWYFCKRLQNIKFPTIKNMNNSFLSEELTSVQPMADCPKGNVFYLDFKYSKPSKKWWQIWKR